MHASFGEHLLAEVLAGLVLWAVFGVVARVAGMLSTALRPTPDWDRPQASFRENVLLFDRLMDPTAGVGHQALMRAQRQSTVNYQYVNYRYAQLQNMAGQPVCVVDSHDYWFQQQSWLQQQKMQNEAFAASIARVYAADLAQRRGDGVPICPEAYKDWLGSGPEGQ